MLFTFFFIVLPLLLVLGAIFAFFLVKDPLCWEKKPLANATIPSAKADVEHLKNHIGTLCNHYSPRSTFQWQKLNQTADFIRNTWENYGLKVQEHPFAVPATSESWYRNLHVQISGENKFSNPLIIGAHYDTTDSTPGADDNASGIAGILELGRLLALPESRKKIAISIELAAYPNEESPFFGTAYMGAYQHAQQIHQAKTAIRGMISLEMIGFFLREKNSQKYPLNIMKYFYPNRGDFIAFVSSLKSRALVRKGKRAFARNSAFPLQSFVGPESVYGLLASDHYSFLLFNFPAMMITDTAYYRNPFYHTEKDTLETLNFDAMAEVITGIYNMVLNWQD